MSWGVNGKRVIDVDPETAPFVVKLFEWFSTGMYSLKQVGNRIRAEGMAYRKSHKPIGTASVHKILRSRIYTGEFDWLGKRYQGSHEPLISVELWERVQGVLDGRHTARIRGVERDCHPEAVLSKPACSGRTHARPARGDNCHLLIGHLV